jgi:hypothetical protein
MKNIFPSHPLSRKVETPNSRKQTAMFKHKNPFLKTFETTFVQLINAGDALSQTSLL